MKLIHFSASKTITGVTSVKQSNNMLDPPRSGIGKPRGFWVSVEGNGDGWSDWCKDTNFAKPRLRYRHEVKLSPDAKILYLQNAADIDQFTQKYRDENSQINKDIADIGPKYGHPSDTMEIDWVAVAKKYQGIIISPYIYSRRLSGHCTWYYGWDCASGVIWDANAVDSISRITSIRRKTGLQSLITS